MNWRAYLRGLYQKRRLTTTFIQLPITSDITRMPFKQKFNVVGVMMSSVSSSNPRNPSGVVAKSTLAPVTQDKVLTDSVMIYPDRGIRMNDSVQTKDDKEYPPHEYGEVQRVQDPNFLPDLAELLAEMNPLESISWWKWPKEAIFDTTRYYVQKP